METNPSQAGNLNQQNFSDLMAQAPVAIGILRGFELVIELANDPMLQVWGKGREVIGMPLAQGLPEIVGQPFISILQGVYTTGVTYYGYEASVFLVRNNVKGQYYFNFVYQPITVPGGAITGIMVIATDVTEQVNSRRKLEDAEERLRLAAEATGLGTFDLDLQNGGIIHSPRLAVIFGRDSSQNITHGELRQIILPADLHIIISAFDEAIITGIYFYEARVIWLDATIHWIRTRGKVLYSNTGVPVRMLGTVQDISEQKRIMQDLSKSEENLRLATQAAELGTFDMDLMNQSLIWDKRCRELFGIDANEPVSYDTSFLLGLHPDDRQKTDDAVTRAFNKSLSNGEYDVEYRTIGIADKRMRWVRAKGKVMFNDEEVPYRFIGTVLDITQNKQDEIRKNDFIAMASHELKTPLTSLKAYIQLLLSKALTAGDAFMINALQKSETQVNKMTKLIYGFLDLSKLESGKLTLDKSETDINSLIEEVVADYRPIAASHIITFDSNGPPLILAADREKIGQVINNLISNAVKYSPKNTAVKVSVQTQEGRVKVSVLDQGIGIKLKDQQNIFKRFYRVEDESTKGFSGFGIGLYLCAEIVELHHGKIGVESQEGQGAEFYFVLPVGS